MGKDNDVKSPAPGDNSDKDKQPGSNPREQIKASKETSGAVKEAASLTEGGTVNTLDDGDEKILNKFANALKKAMGDVHFTQTSDTHVDNMEKSVLDKLKARIKAQDAEYLNKFTGYKEYVEINEHLNNVSDHPGADILVDLIIDLVADQLKENRPPSDAYKFFCQYFTIKDKKLYLSGNRDLSFLRNSPEADDPYSHIISSYANSIEKIIENRLDKNINKNSEEKFLKNAEHHIKRVMIGDVAFLYLLDKWGLFRVLEKLVQQFTKLSNYRMPYLPASYSRAILRVSDLLRSSLYPTEPVRNHMYKGSIGYQTPRDKAYERKQRIMNPNRFLKQKQFINYSCHEKGLETKFLWLTYLREKRVLHNIGTLAPQSFAATTIAVKDTMRLWVNTFEEFDYNHHIAVCERSLIMAAIAFCLVEKCIPFFAQSVYYESDQYMTIAKNCLVLNRPANLDERDKFISHRNAANYLRTLFNTSKLAYDSRIFDNLELSEAFMKVNENSIEGFRASTLNNEGIDIVQLKENDFTNFPYCAIYDMKKSRQSEFSY